MQAAVVIPIARHREPTIIFVRRADHLRRNPGQVAFPGGLVDAGDGDDRMTTALRECEEELGIARDRLRVIGRLDDTEVFARNVRITPFVALLDPPYTLQPDASEIAEVFEVPVTAVFAPNAVHEGDEPVGNGLIRTWQFDYAAMHVWGATGQILQQFVSRYTGATEQLLAV
ncbi:MAG: NUDIX hydrolase [Vulcanimicrobiaceae bacterium]